MTLSAEESRTWSRSRTGAARPAATAWWPNHSAAGTIRRSSGTSGRPDRRPGGGPDQSSRPAGL